MWHSEHLISILYRGVTTVTTENFEDLVQKMEKMKDRKNEQFDFRGLIRHTAGAIAEKVVAIFEKIQETTVETKTPGAEKKFFLYKGLKPQLYEEIQSRSPKYNQVYEYYLRDLGKSSNGPYISIHHFQIEAEGDGTGLGGVQYEDIKVTLKQYYDKNNKTSIELEIKQQEKEKTYRFWLEKNFKVETVNSDTGDFALLKKLSKTDFEEIFKTHSEKLLREEPLSWTQSAIKLVSSDPDLKVPMHRFYTEEINLKKFVKDDNTLTDETIIMISDLHSFIDSIPGTYKHKYFPFVLESPEQFFNSCEFSGLDLLVAQLTPKETQKVIERFPLMEKEVHYKEMQQDMETKVYEEIQNVLTHEAMQYKLSLLFPRLSPLKIEQVIKEIEQVINEIKNEITEAQKEMKGVTPHPITLINMKRLYKQVEILSIIVKNLRQENFGQVFEAFERAERLPLSYKDSIVTKVYEAMQNVLGHETIRELTQTIPESTWWSKLIKGFKPRPLGYTD